MKHCAKSWKNVVGVFIATSLLLVASASGSAVSSNVPVISPEEAQEMGMSYADLSVKWWQYLLETPVESSPEFDDEVGTNCSEQSGPVVFLVSSTGGTTTRQCVVPANSYLFFPLLTSLRFQDPAAKQPEQAARSSIQGFLNTAKVFEATIDGEKLDIDLNPKKSPLRTQSPEGFFTITAPVNNIFGGVPGQVYNAVSDGYFLLLGPMSPGSYIITFGGSTPNFDAYVTYHLTVE